MRKEPKFRSETKEAINELAISLGLPNEPDMQDWSYSVADTERIDDYLALYRETMDSDKKFVLMQMIIQAVNDQMEGRNSTTHLEILERILKEDFDIHEYTIFYWALLEDETFTDIWAIAPFMRELWSNQP